MYSMYTDMRRVKIGCHTPPCDNAKMLYIFTIWNNGNKKNRIQKRGM